MKTPLLSALCACAILCSTSAVQAQDLEGAARAYVTQIVAEWSSDPMIISAIQSQNSQTNTLTEAEIIAMDEAWRAETTSATTPTIDAVITNDASAFLRARVAESGGIISEVFVMDSVGLNVASSGVTSDYWQGDEAKFTQTYPVGPDAVHLGDLELDESTQLYQIQVSTPIIDSTTNQAIGAITVGVNAEAL